MVNLKTIRLATLVGLLASAFPLRAIVDASGNPESTDISYGQVVDGINFGGVVEVTTSIGGCSGTLLTDGYSILTAGHCVTSAYGQPIATGINVVFMGPSGPVSETVSNVQVDPLYTGDSTQGSDLAVLTLSQQAPSFAVGYSLFDSSEIPTTPVILAGYGYGGTGDTGYTEGYGTLRAGTNEYEGNGQTLFGFSSGILGGQFYDATTPSTNALNVPDPYSAADEVDISFGDSGGPTFYDGEIIGVHDFIDCASLTDNGPCTVPPSENADLNSYFGQLFGDTSVYSNISFIEGAELPEPGTIGLMLCGMALLIWRGTKKTSQRRPLHSPAGG